MRNSRPIRTFLCRVWFLSPMLASAVLLGFALTGTRALAADVDAAVEKANAYTELAESTERAVESWERYQSWVNMKTGPTGKERYIDYGLYELSDTASLVKEAREMVGKAPNAAKLDALIVRYLTAYEALAPVMNEAAAYYEQKGYVADKLAKGKALHTKIVAARHHLSGRARGNDAGAAHVRA